MTLVVVLALASFGGVADASASTGLLCRLPGANDVRALKVKPTVCSTLGPRDSYATAVQLRDLSWRNWGRSSATATGIVRSWKNYGTLTSPALVRAWRPRRFCGGRRFVYTRMQLRNVSTGYLGGLIKFPVCE